MAVAVETRDNDLTACSVVVVGTSSLVTFLEDIARMNHVKDLKKPIFIVAGANDPRVPKSEADQMVAALHRQGTPVWYLAAKDEGHGFAKKKNADFQFYATIEFVEKYLLGPSSK